MTVHQAPNLLFEMLRSFVELAGSLNLSRATDVTGLTRQTLKRHIASLEELRGVRLFELVDRRYVLTPDGEAALPEARALLERGVAWVRAERSDVGGLLHVASSDGSYVSRELPINRLWDREGEVSTRVYDAWSAARAALDHQALDPLRSAISVFRPYGDDWICSTVGPDSLIAELIGPTRAQSSAGVPLTELCRGEYAQFVRDAYGSVASSTGLRFDHVTLRTADRETVNYVRLILAIRFADGSNGVAVFGDKTATI